MTVRYRQEGATSWIERLLQLNPAKDFVLTEHFEYKTVYEFSGRLKYEDRFGVYSPLIKMLSPGTLVPTFFQFLQSLLFKVFLGTRFHCQRMKALLSNCIERE